MTGFPYETDLQVRFRDLDAYGHVNNAVYATYVEQARVGFLEDALGDDLPPRRMVVASLELDFEAPVTDARRVAVGVRLERVGTSSFELAYALHAGGTRVATARTVQVVVDPETGDPDPVPDDWRDRLVAAGEG